MIGSPACWLSGGSLRQRQRCCHAPSHGCSRTTPVSRFSSWRPRRPCSCGPCDEGGSRSPSSPGARACRCIDLDGLHVSELRTSRGAGVAVADSHPFAVRDWVQPDELADQAWVVGASHGDSPEFGAWPGIAEPAVSFAVHDWPTRLGLVSAGLGIAQSGLRRPSRAARRPLDPRPRPGRRTAPPGLCGHNPRRLPRRPGDGPAPWRTRFHAERLEQQCAAWLTKQMRGTRPAATAAADPPDEPLLSDRDPRRVARRGSFAARWSPR